jgi:energy-coupling factor transporter ATP-binding protein EcfA2
MLNLQTKRNVPPRILIYGPQGIGKSTFISKSMNPVLIQTEDGLGNLDIPAYPLAKSYADVMAAITELATVDHNYNTVAVDSADWLEPLIWKQVAVEAGKKSIEDIGYGKGYVLALDLWREYIGALNYLRDEKNMTVIQTAHANIKRFDNPETESYDRYEIKLHKAASALMLEHSDIVFFANYYVSVSKEETGFNKKRKIAVGGRDRILYTEERPSAIAKNRYGLPEEIPFDKDGGYWNIIAQHVPYYNAQQSTNEKDA